MGKAYANRKKKSERPDADFYPTPKFLVKKLLKERPDILNSSLNMLEPANGDGAISSVLAEYGINMETHDLRTDGVDFLTYTPTKKIDTIITNPPFSLFDEFVKKATEISTDVWMIGKVNFLGAHKRNIEGLWDTLEDVYVFDRMVDYRPSDPLGIKFSCGMLVTGWFHFNKNKDKNMAARLYTMDVQDGVIFK